MNTLLPSVFISPPRRGAFSFLLLAIAVLMSLVTPVQAAGTGTITGTVNNSATKNTLEGAAVSIPSLSLNTLTDDSGQFVFNNVPAGTYDLVISYIGLDTVQQSVVVGEGQRATRDIALTTGIYKLAAFSVTGEREGNAAMITEKRNADNVKDVIAMDAFGYLPNMSAGEVVMRLPGVAGSPTDEGLAYNFNIRGMGPALNNVTVDGGTLTSLGTNRAFELQSITGAMFEGMELIKGQTPDKGADSLGGTINFKTRSTFSMKEDSRTTYNASTRWAPPFFEQTPIRSEHRAHPIFNLTHQQVFSAFGGERNLGMSVNLFYSENAVGGFETIFDRTSLLNGPAPVWNYQTWDNTNNRKQQSIAFKTDYKWSANSKFSLNVTENDNFERLRRRIRVTAQTGANTTAVGTSAIQPGFTNTVTTVRSGVIGTSANASNIDVQMDGPLNYYVRMGRVDFTGEHTYGAFNLEYYGSIARTTLNTGQGRGGQLNMRYFDPSRQTRGANIQFGGAGWILDQSKSELHPAFIQNGGADFTDPNNYMPRLTDGLVSQRNEADQLQKQFHIDAKYKLPIEAPISVKGGFSWRGLQMDQWAGERRRWVPKATTVYDPTVHFQPDTSYVSYDRVKTGRAIPIYQAEGAITTDGKPTNPSLWNEDMYYFYSQYFVGTNRLLEYVPAYYLMAQGRLGTKGWLSRTGFLAGMRFEEVSTEATGWARSRVLSTAAQQLADPFGWAQRDYANNPRNNSAKFHQNFPSIHAFHDITSNLKARLSYSTSYGRAPIASLLPVETPNDTARTITFNNPGIKPQQAANWDATLEYYFEPVGSLTFGWFHKKISDYIVSGLTVGRVPTGPDNGYNGEYADYDEITTTNAGDVYVQGWEFAYNQQFTFLPGLLKGLSASFNYSKTDQHGLGAAITTGGTPILGASPGPGRPAVYFGSRDIVGFIPWVYNASLNWRYRKFRTGLLYNVTGENPTTVSILSPALSQFRETMKTLNVSAGYQYRPNLGFSVNASNILNEPQVWYIGYKDRMRRTTINFVTVTFGVDGRF